MKKISRTALLITVVFLNVNSIKAQCAIGTAESKLSELELTTDCLLQFLNSHSIADEYRILETKGIQVDQQKYVLIRALDKNEARHLFAVKLEIQEDNLVIAEKEIYHSCETADFSISSFQFEDSQIVGCLEAEHSIYARQ